jgi:hypothetical protein
MLEHIGNKGFSCSIDNLIEIDVVNWRKLCMLDFYECENGKVNKWTFQKFIYVEKFMMLGALIINFHGKSIFY